MKKIPQDIIGNIAILKFPKHTLWIKKKLLARTFIKKHPSIKTILEKTEGFSGRLRKPTLKHLWGEKTFQTIYKENNCLFKINVQETYFSPRLSNERKLVAEKIIEITKRKKSPRILIMFAGIAPFPIVIAKHLQKEKKTPTIVSNELNKKANELAQQNIDLNKLTKYITLMPGDAKKLMQKKQEPYDVIVMARPNLKETFLPAALTLTKKGTTIFYHGFGTKEKVKKEIEKETKNKIGNIHLRKAGDIKAYEYRWLATFKTK